MMDHFWIASAVRHLAVLTLFAGHLLWPPGAPRPAPTKIGADSTPPPCEVTLPNGNRQLSNVFDDFAYGNGALWVGLWPEGITWISSAQIEPDGSLGMKFLWDRGEGARGKLTIEGRRLDDSAPPLRSDVPDGYGDTGLQASGIYFSTTGCWEVTGRVGDVSLTFVTLVVIGQSPYLLATPVATPTG